MAAKLIGTNTSAEIHPKLSPADSLRLSLLDSKHWRQKKVKLKLLWSIVSLNLHLMIFRLVQWA